MGVCCRQRGRCCHDRQSNGICCCLLLAVGAVVRRGSVPTSLSGLLLAVGVVGTIIRGENLLSPLRMLQRLRLPHLLVGGAHAVVSSQHL